MNRKITKLFTLAAALFVAATTLSGCFPENNGPQTFTTGDVIFEGKVTDYYKKPINKIPDGFTPDSVMVILYRASNKDQTLVSTPVEQICDTVWVDAQGNYQIKDSDLSEVSNVYGLYICDAAGAYQPEERFFLSQEATVYERGDKYELVTYYNCTLFTKDWPGLNN